MTEGALSKLDVERLLTDPSADARAETATKIAAQYGTHLLTPAERSIAEQIFRLLVNDAETRVRGALVASVRESPHMPRDVALALANDVADIAAPVLRWSEVLTDADLVEIVTGRDMAKLAAVAERARLSETTSGALIRNGDEGVVVRVLNNKGAAIADPALGTALDRFSASEQLHEALIGRDQLPLALSERLVTLASDRLKVKLATHHALQGDAGTDLILQARERAVIALSVESDSQQLDGLIRQLHGAGRLTVSLCMRALCTGDLRFFEEALAHLAGISPINARALIYDTGRNGLAGLFVKAKLPASQLTTALAAIAVVNEAAYDGREGDRERYARRVIERILTQYGDLGVSFESDDLDYLLAKVAKLPSGVGASD